MQAQEQERAALAATLREDVCQRMAALTLRLHDLEGAAHDGEVADINAELTRPSARSPRRRIRPISGSSYWVCAPQDVGSARTYRRSLMWRFHFRDEDVPGDIPLEIALALFRVLQEATVDAVVHSGAPEIWVSMRIRGGGPACESSIAASL